MSEFGIIGSIWFNHHTKKTHKLVSWSPSTGCTLMEFENLKFKNEWQPFHFNWYDEETDTWTKQQDFLCQYNIYDWDEEHGTYTDYFESYMECIDNPNPTETLIKFLRNKKIKRIIEDNE
jgi:hypothetical protein